MKVEGEHVLPFPRPRVWEALMDPALLSRTLPGCERLESTGENAYRGVMKVQVGPVRGVFQGQLALSQVTPPEGYRMHLKGQGSTGFMDGEGTIALEEAGEGATRLRYDLDFQVGGRIAGVGQRVLEASGRSVARQGLEGLEREIAGPSPTMATATASATAPAVAAAPRREPSQAAMASRLAADVAADLTRGLVPVEHRSLWAGGILVAVGVVLGWLLRGRR